MQFYDSQQALGFLVSQTSHIEREVYEIQYPDIQYPNLIPVDTTANEWAKSITFYSMDKVGQADWFNHGAKDVPIADIERSKFEVGIEMAAIGYRYSLEELGQAMMIPGMNLSSERAAAARRAYEEFVDDVALRGNTAKGWTGLINNTDVTAVSAATGTWGSATGDQVIGDVNTGILGAYTASKTVEMADTALIPVSAFNDISTKRLGDTNQTVLSFLQQNNTYTAMTGRPLTIRAVRGLETAGAGSTRRMILYRRDPQVLKMHMPMPHRFLPVWQTGPMVFDVPGVFRLGPLEIRRPGAVRYVDGI